MRILFLFAGLFLLACGCETNTADTSTRDNTAINERDAEGYTPTPFDQSNEQSDIDLVAEIRSRVLDVDDLSTNGRNVKIITNQGKAVLRGPVGSEAERDAIANIAKDVVGAENVDNQLEIERE
ncbi:MAG TPA: BON domain-containing protein [Pirellulaceae bacterium]|nr:BON domain-containing protein [Pirellulaceae bacterium]